MSEENRVCSDSDDLNIHDKRHHPLRFWCQDDLFTGSINNPQLRGSARVANMKTAVPARLFSSYCLFFNCPCKSVLVSSNRQPDIWNLRLSVVIWSKPISEHNFPMYKSKKHRNRQTMTSSLFPTVRWLVLEYLPILLPRLPSSTTWISTLQLAF